MIIVYYYLIYLLQNGDTVLHIACRRGDIKMLQFILSTGRANPIAQNNRKQMPFELIPPHHNERFQLQKLFEPFQVFLEHI